MSAKRFDFERDDDETNKKCRPFLFISIIMFFCVEHEHFSIISFQYFRGFIERRRSRGFNLKTISFFFPSGKCLQTK